MARLDVPGGAEFAAELDNSTASLALSRTAPVARRAPGSLWEWEQRITDGHPYHPCCRSRPGFTAAEQLAYGPEHGPVVGLGLVAADDCLTVGAWPDGLRNDGAVLLPVHPWQAEHVLGLRAPDDRTPDRRLPDRRLPDRRLPDDRLPDDRLPDGRTQNRRTQNRRTRGRRVAVERPAYGAGHAARPLMSLRTLAPAGGELDGVHIKTTLSTRLTSSVRDISLYSIEHSAAVSALLESLAERLDGRLHITRTLAAAAGSPDLAAMLRESPDRYARPGEQVVPVAALPLP
ncbi:hypothetical protein GUY61_28710, partial [Streptomyces sp. GC420]|nr:hypothetical protein [Streptomyces sp. GC420]